MNTHKQWTLFDPITNFVRPCSDSFERRNAYAGPPNRHVLNMRKRTAGGLRLRSSTTHVYQPCSLSCPPPSSPARRISFADRSLLLVNHGLSVPSRPKWLSSVPGTPSCAMKSPMASTPSAWLHVTAKRVQRDLLGHSDILALHDQGVDIHGRCCVPVP